VFVHCAAGASRSPTFIIAYLMKKYKKDYQTAYNLVKSKSQYIYPNPGFAQQLKIY
jgi:dual specificity phosphatase 12